MAPRCVRKRGGRMALSHRLLKKRAAKNLDGPNPCRERNNPSKASNSGPYHRKACLQAIGCEPLHVCLASFKWYIWRAPSVCKKVPPIRARHGHRWWVLIWCVNTLTSDKEEECTIRAQQMCFDVGEKAAQMNGQIRAVFGRLSHLLAEKEKAIMIWVCWLESASMHLLWRPDGLVLEHLWRSFNGTL